MKKKNASVLRRALATAALLCVSVQAGAITIGFEEFGNVGTSGPAVTNQYAGVVFSSLGGYQNLVSSQAGIGNGLNFICTGAGFINCTQDTILTFASGVSGLTFLQVGDNDPNGTVVAAVDVYVAGLLAGTTSIFSDGDFGIPNLVDLSAYNNVTSIHIRNITDSGGLGWDDFTFTVGATQPVPEPGTLALLGIGLAGLGFSRRRSA